MTTIINCQGKIIDLSEPKIMGILNVTPDSFFDGGKYFSEQTIKQRVKQLVDEGADIIDVGAYSSRPGADDVPPDEELRRLSMALDIIRKFYPDLCISVDTFRPEIAEFVIKNYNISLINDIMGGAEDEKMFEVVAKYNVGYILMHIQGTPKTMQINPTYDDVVSDIIKIFSKKIDKLRYLGVNDIIIDPGFGFGKTIEHNYQILKRLKEFKIFDLPILVGISRKSMIYKLLNLTPQQVLPATLGLNMVALLNGANILRVHDVKETRQIVEVFKFYRKVK